MVSVIDDLLESLRRKDTSLLELRERYKILIREYDDRYVLNYDITSTRRFDPITRVCRQLIITSDFSRVLCRSFDRFFNLGEDPDSEKFDIAHAVVEEKLDGSLVALYHDGQAWQYATRTQAFAEGVLNDQNMTFRKRITKNCTFPENLANKKYTYIFEFCSPYNQIVTKYEKARLSLLAVRETETGTYIDKHVEGERIGYNDFPKEYHFSSNDEILQSVRTLPAQEEGYVCRIGDWRIKIKNPAYLVAAHSMSDKQIKELVLAMVAEYEEQEFMAACPEHAEITKKYVSIRDNAEKYISQRFVKIRNNSENRKAFSFIVQNEEPKYLWPLYFAMYDNDGEFAKTFKKIQANVSMKCLLAWEEIVW